MLFLFGQENAEAEEVAVPYRFSMTPARNGLCNVFVPNLLGANDGVRLGRASLSKP